jgi:hypothetical protein
VSRRTFIIIAVAWLVALALSASDLGAMVGFLAGVTVAMFGGALGVALQSAAAALGISLGWSAIGQILAAVLIGVVALLALVQAVKGALRLRRADEPGALAAWAGTMSICAAAGCLWLGSASLVRVWP